MTFYVIWCTIKIWNGDYMLNTNHEKVENFFDYLDNSALAIYEHTKMSYLDALLLAVDYLLENEEKLTKLEDEILDKLKSLASLVLDISFNKEEIRKAFQLALLKAFKHLNISYSDITPDSIGLLYAYLTDLLYQSNKKISILDATVGSGNLLFSFLNNTNVHVGKIYGVDINSKYINIAYYLAELLEYEVEFFNQDNLDKMLVPPVDLIISDLPTDEIVNIKDKITYKPYLMIENLFKYAKSGSYMIYLIPNNFFDHPKNDVMKNIILQNSYIQAILQLPSDMFKDISQQKSILILRKKGENVSVTREILMLSFPSFSEQVKVKIAFDKINHWYKHNIKS